MSQIEAIVFDMDGVLLDSQLMINTAIHDVLAAHGLATTPEQLRAIAGQPVEVMYRTMAPGQNAAELAKEHLAHHETHLDLMRAYAGAAVTLATLHNQYKLGVFTGFNELSRQRLARFELDQYFDTIVDATMYAKHKPDPEGLLLGLDRLGVSPSKAVYVGDAANDISAGLAAKVRAAIGITHGVGTREYLQAAGADYIIDSLPELPALLKKL